MVAMPSLDGQSDFNIWSRNYSNHLAFPTSWALKLVAQKFTQASNCPLMVGLSDIARYNELGQATGGATPFELVYVPNPKLAFPSAPYSGAEFLTLMEGIGRWAACALEDLCCAFKAATSFFVALCLVCGYTVHGACGGVMHYSPPCQRRQDRPIYRCGHSRGSGIRFIRLDSCLSSTPPLLPAGAHRIRLHSLWLRRQAAVHEAPGIPPVVYPPCCCSPQALCGLMAPALGGPHPPHLTVHHSTWRMTSMLIRSG
jgi:hypothetical protein